MRNPRVRNRWDERPARGDDREHRDDDDEVWVEWVASVRHVGTFPIDDMALPPTGRRRELHGITVAEFAGERIVGFRQYWDCAALMDNHASSRPSRGRLQRG